MYQFHTIQIIISYLEECKQGSNPQGAEVMRLDVPMKGDNGERSESVKRSASVDINVSYNF